MLCGWLLSVWFAVVFVVVCYVVAGLASLLVVFGWVSGIVAMAVFLLMLWDVGVNAVINSVDFAVLICILLVCFGLWYLSCCFV